MREESVGVAAGLIQLQVQLQECPLLSHHFPTQQGNRRTPIGQELIMKVMPQRLFVGGCRRGACA